MRPRARAPRVVLAASRGVLAHIVLECLRALGAETLLICDSRSSVRYSTFARKLLFAGADWEQQPRQLIRILNEEHDRCPIDVVLGTSVEGLIALNSIASELQAPLFPTVSSELIRELHDKDRFFAVCERYGVMAPPTLCFDEISDVSVDEVETRLGFPCMVKPVSEFGSIGVKAARSREELIFLLKNPDSTWKGKVIVQRQIIGPDVHAVLFAENGNTISCFSYRDIGKSLSIRFASLPDLESAASSIVRKAGYTGIACFDAIEETPSGAFYMLECNPRFFRRLRACQYAGFDLLATGLQRTGIQIENKRVRTSDSYIYLQDALSSLGGDLLLHRNFPFRSTVDQLRYLLADPVPKIAPVLKKYVEAMAVRLGSLKPGVR